MKATEQSGQCRRWYTCGIVFGSDFQYNGGKNLVFLQEGAIERSENTLDILSVLVLRLWTLLDWRRGRRSVHAGQAAGDKKRVTV